MSDDAIIRGDHSLLRRAAADFWLNQLFQWSEISPLSMIAWRPVLCWFAWRCSRSIHRGVMANARRILGPNSSIKQQEKLAWETMQSFFWFCFDVGRNLHAAPEELEEKIERIDGHERYLRARAKRRGVILVTAHMGSFEVAMAALRHIEPRIHVLFQRDAFSRFESQRSELRRKLGVQEVALDEGWTVWMRLRDALLADEALLLQGDRVLPGQKGEKFPILHGHLELPAGPVKLAMMTGSPIVPVFSVRQPEGKIRLFIEEPIEVDGDADAAM
ncbi:MAG TPA: hypothetical protein VMD30_08480, partial [Tepidisphaeraceae bacterium]|nr:hypothetical protein [Tepidisphaeraceae bacterium]